MDKPEALRLAEYLEQDPCSKAHHDEAAAELRRLSAIETQRDALLNSLKEIHTLMYTTSVVAKQAIERLSNEKT